MAWKERTAQSQVCHTISVDAFLIIFVKTRRGPTVSNFSCLLECFVTVTAGGYSNIKGNYELYAEKSFLTHTLIKVLSLVRYLQIRILDSLKVDSKIYHTLFQLTDLSSRDVINSYSNILV